MRLLAAIAVLALVLSFGCIQQPSEAAPAPGAPLITETKPPAPPAPQNETEPMPCASGSVLERDECFSLLAASSSNISYCDKIYSIDTKDNCIAGFAANDGSLCERLFSSALRSECFLNYAVFENDFKLCERIGDKAKRGECMAELAPPCTLEPDESSRSLCMALGASNHSLCVGADCLMGYAAEKSEASACAQIPESSGASKYACLALAHKDSSRCSDAPQAAIADYCYLIYAQRTNDALACDYATLGSPYRDSCYAHFALLDANPNLCSRSSSEEQRDLCYLDYSIRANSPSTCAKVINSLNRAKCYITTAKENGNPAACSGLFYRDVTNCYNIVFTGTGVLDISYCAQIEDAFWKDKCYVNFARTSLDTSACKFVVDEGQRAACLAPFGG